MNRNSFIPNQKAFAFSADIVLALILVVSLLFFVSFPTQPAPKLEERRITDQYVDDIFVALDHSGYIANEIDTNGFSSQTLSRIYTRAQSHLPDNYDLFLALKSYPVDVNKCRTYQDFTNCFPDANVSSLSQGITIPSNAPFVHGRRIFLKQQPASQCSIVSPARPQDPSNLYHSYPASLHSPDGSPDLNIHFDVNVQPSGPLTCDQNITAALSVTANTGARKPVDMMLVIDRSGSMSWDSQLDTSNPQGLFVSGNGAYVADGSSGLRDVNISNPGLPLLLGTYNSPGTARDVAVSGNYAYLADGTQGLRVVNIGNPSAPISAASLNLGNDAYGVATNGSTTYIATFGSSTTDQTNTGTSNANLTIGQSSSAQYAGQSFIPSINFMTGAAVYVRKVGNPSNGLTVNIRSTLTGTDIASATIPASSITTSYQLISSAFSDAVSLSSGSTYYLVLTTSTNNASNYYQWGARSNSTYGNGEAYQNSTAQGGDARFQTHYLSGLIKINTSTPTIPQVVGATALTDAWRIFLNGNNAYIADGSAGLRIFDVSGNTPLLLGTYNTSGTAYDAVVSGSYAYVSDGTSGLVIVNISNPSSPALTGSYNTPGTAYATRLSGTTAYVADGTSMQVLDVSNPVSPLFIKRYATPWTYRDLEIQGSWGYVNVSTGVVGLISLNLSNGPKIDQAKVAATTFVDFNGWDSNDDQMGLVSYSSNATTDQTLTRTYSLVKADINVLVASGGTGTGEAITAATIELNSIRHNPNALKFQVLMTDGLTNTGSSSNSAAITAKNRGIVIYTIGFGADADATELQNIATITGGQFYQAFDQNALVDVYNLIAQNIQQLATDANLVASFSGGTIIVDDGNGLLAGNNLIFDINTQEPQPWTATYTFNIPCTSQLACSSTLISIPSPGTQFQYIDVNGNPQTLDWNVFSTQTFQYRDLNIDIIGGNLLGSNNVDLSVKVSSVGNKDTNASSVRFYKNAPAFGSVIGNTSVPALCGKLVPGCVNYEYTFTQNVGAEGDLYGVVNPDGIIPECTFNNQDVIFCYFIPSTQFFTLDYWVWLRG